MPPTDRFVIRFAAEPPQDAPVRALGRHASRPFLAAIDADRSEDEELGEIGEIIVVSGSHVHGAHLRPAVARTARATSSSVRLVLRGRRRASGPADFEALADFTAEIAESNPDWKLDLNDEVIGSWRGEQGKRG